MKQRSFFLVLLIVVISLFSLAGGIFAWTVRSGPLSLAKSSLEREPQASLLVPKQSPLMVSLLVNPDSLENLTSARVPLWQRARVQRDIKKLEMNLLKSTGLDYRQEIKPWLGQELTLAITSLDYDHDNVNGTQPGYLLAVETKNSQLAKEFLQSAYSQNALKGNNQLKFESYKGVNIITQNSLKPKTDTFLNSSAVLADFVLFANRPRILREAINTLQVANLSLKSSPLYSRALKTVEPSRLGLVYANLPLVSAWLGNVAAPVDSSIVQTLTVNLTLDEEGLVAQTALINDNISDSSAPILSGPVGAFKYMPSDSIVALAGSDLPELWDKIDKELADNSPLQQLLNDALKRLENNLGQIVITEDIFPWVKGEFALALIDTTTSPEWLFAVERRPAVIVGIENLNKIATDQGLGFGSVSVLGNQATVWSQLENQQDSSNLNTLVKGIHATVGNYEIFASSVEALKIAIKSSTRTNIGLLQDILPQSNDGYFYLNWEKFAPLVAQKYPITKVAQLPLDPVLEHLKSLILTSLGRKDGVSQASVYFNLSSS